VKLLGFTGVKSGMTVLDMGAGGGYSTELMARACRRNRQGLWAGFREIGRAPNERFEARMKTPTMKNVVVLDRKFDDPLPADAAQLDPRHVLLFSTMTRPI